MELSKQWDEKRLQWIAARQENMTQECKGVAYWEYWCTEQGIEWHPTQEKIRHYIDDFVVPLEQAINNSTSVKNPLAPGVHFSGDQVLIEPLKRRYPNAFAGDKDEQTAPPWSRPSLPDALTVFHGPDGPVAASTSPHHLGMTCRKAKIINNRGNFQDESFAEHTVVLPPFSASLFYRGQKDKSEEDEAEQDHVPISPINETPRDYIRLVKRVTMMTPPKSSSPEAPPSLSFVSTSTTAYDHRAKRVHEIDITKFNAKEFHIIDCKLLSGGNRAELSTFDDMAMGPIYYMSDEVETVVEVLTEWRFGLYGGRAIQDLNEEFKSTQWLASSDKFKYEVRSTIVSAYKYFVLSKGLTTKKAVQELQFISRSTGLATIYDNLRVQKELSEPKNHEGVMGTVAATADRHSASSVFVDKRGTKRAKLDPRSEYAPSPETTNGTSPKATASHNRPSLLSYRHEPRRHSRNQDHHRDRHDNHDKNKKMGEKPNKTLNNKPQVPFPFPMRDFHSVDNIWHEWQESWRGEPSLKALIKIHGRPWVHDPKIAVDIKVHFRSKDRLVAAILKALKQQAVASPKEAIRVLEAARENMTPSAFCSSPAFDQVLMSWGV
ncbi:hypothetical protein BGZ83_002117 [Gryganskiella cystojenkinii]|nr:hypothetical protein BGZ83_002117 [Gryganskiella cystojenkinii]